MKKGLLLTLVFAVALISSSFANAPMITPIPDIIIGDIEQGDTNNLFIFSDAFVFDSYVADNDTTPLSDLKWSFAQIGGTQNIVINDMEQETADPTFMAPTNDIRNGFTTASFRNDTLSPRTGAIPYPNPTTLSDAHLVFYVSDGTYIDSDDIIVYSADNAEDGYSVGVAPDFVETFGPSTMYVFSGGSTSPYGSYDLTNQRIVLTSPGAGWPNWYEWWVLKEIGNLDRNLTVPYFADSVFAMKCRLSCDANTTIPLLRVRIGADDFKWAFTFEPKSTNNDPDPIGELGGVRTTPRDYVMYWQPQDTTAKAFVTFDEWEYQGGWSGSIYVDEFKIYHFPISAMTVAGEAMPDITTFTGWTSGTGITFGPPLQIADTAGWTTTGKHFTLNSPMAIGDVYRIKYNTSKVGSARCDVYRIRANDSQNGAYVSTFVLTDSRQLPGDSLVTGNIETTPKDYISYHVAGNNRATIAPFTGLDLTLWIDAVQDVTGAATIQVNKIEVDKVIMPVLGD